MHGIGRGRRCFSPALRHCEERSSPNNSFHSPNSPFFCYRQITRILRIGLLHFVRNDAKRPQNYNKKTIEKTRFGPTTDFSFQLILIINELREKSTDFSQSKSAEIGSKLALFLRLELYFLLCFSVQTFITSSPKTVEIFANVRRVKLCVPPTHRDTSGSVLPMR